MKFSIERKILLEKLQLVTGYAASRATLPILNNILFDVGESSATLTATNLETGIKVKIPTNCEESIKLTIPAKKLLDIVRSLDTAEADDLVCFDTGSNDRVTISHSKAKFKLSYISSDEFPQLAEMKEDDIIAKVDVQELNTVIDRTIYCISSDPTRYFLGGLYMHLKDNIITWIGTDGRRLSKMTIENQISRPITSDDKGIGFIIPAAGIHQIRRSFTEGNISIGMADTQLCFGNDDQSITTRLIEGEYPDYDAIINPSLSNERIITVDKAKLLAAIKRVALFTNSKIGGLKLDQEDGKMKLSANVPDLGEAEETIEAEGQSIIISLNALFLSNVISQLPANKVIMAFRDALSPVLIKPEGDDSYLNIIMPMRI